MPWLLPPVFYGSDEDRAKAISEAEAKEYRLVRDDRSVSSDRERPHRLTFEVGRRQDESSGSSQVAADGSGASAGVASRRDKVVAKLRNNSATLQDVIEYLRIRDGL